MTSGTTSGPRRPSGSAARPVRPARPSRSATPSRSKRAAAEPAVRPGRKLPTRRVPSAPTPSRFRLRLPSRLAFRLPVRWQLVNLVLGVLLVTAAVFAGLALNRWQDQHELEAVRQEAL